MENTYLELLPKNKLFSHNTAFDIFSSGPDYGAAGSAAAAGYERAAQIYKQMYDQARTDLKPGIEAYGKTVPYYGGLLGIPGYDAVDPTATLRATPGYQFTMDQGQDALSRYAAARGASMSPATMKGIQTYGQGVADKTYQQYLQNVSGFMGAGQNAAAQTGQFGTQAAQGMGQAYIGAGNAQANSILAQGLQRQSGYGGLGSLIGMGAGILTAPMTGGTSLIGSAISGLSGLLGGGSTPSITSSGLDWLYPSIGY